MRVDCDTLEIREVYFGYACIYTYHTYIDVDLIVNPSIPVVFFIHILIKHLKDDAADRHTCSRIGHYLRREQEYASPNM